VRGLRVSTDGLTPWTWAEAWVGGDWLPVNPIEGMVPADASLVRLLIGGVTLHGDLDRLISRAQLNVLHRVSSGTP
jgi:hypothetical protein